MRLVYFPRGDAVERVGRKGQAHGIVEENLWGSRRWRAAAVIIHRLFNNYYIISRGLYIRTPQRTEFSLFSYEPLLFIKT